MLARLREPGVVYDDLPDGVPGAVLVEEGEPPPAPLPAPDPVVVVTDEAPVPAQED